MSRRLVALLISVWFGGIAFANAAERIRVLPTERCGEFFFVQMEFAEDPERVLSMLLDTGASHTVIDPDPLERVSGTRVAIGKRARLPTLAAGEVTFSGISARVMSLDHLQIVLGKPLDGILGYPAFRKVLLTMDYPNEEVRVRIGSLPSPDGKRIFRTFKEKRRPLVKLDFGTESRLVLLDSGSFGGLLVNDSARLRTAEEPIAFDSSLRIDRVMIRSGARLAGDLRFGATTLISPTIVVGNSTDLVGARVLRHFSVTYDQKNRRVMFERATQAPIEFPSVREIGWALRPRKRGLEVLRVFDGLGASRAGVRPGDLVLAIDGIGVYDRDLCDHEPEKRSQVQLTVERAGRRIDFDVAVDVVVP
ncbi:MAG: PDZ domain-containing protein [Acidobacteria bacterium]|nr:PDZ domain-containing protein [Acidobacteriota bacterium]NIM63272.1 PDZ domain-containing protein [Acidobacteriota bacterium]NIO60844.1 PDZ domain-containing protein [Acidobacteriota bacterium]NIQ31923.1 PDZ domain-containing protein [Acidobacteriota bacterium]NIQ87299.1 PDZ domain-containing protein [Acidobacteriota bacterium]